MKIAYFILVNENASQVGRIVRRLTAPNAWFFIHVDAKEDLALYRQDLQGFPPLKVEFIKREVTRWGGAGVVQATLNGLQAFCAHPEKLDYIILLSEQSYPIQNVKFIDNFLEQYAQKIFMHHHPLMESERERVERYHFVAANPRKFPPDNPPQSLKGKILNRLLALRYPLPRRFPAYIKPFSGSPWWGLPHDSAQYIFQFLKAHPDYLKFHRYTQIPEEGFFQTIFLNSTDDRIRERIVNNDLNYVDWFKPNVPLPAVLWIEDFNAIVHSKNLFARRFDAKVDSQILDMIDRHIEA